MNFINRLALASVFALAVVGGTGCATECTKDNETGATKCTVESLVQFKGSVVTQEAAWKAGDNLEIIVNGGNIRIGEEVATSVRVFRGTGSGKVITNFKPFVSRKGEEEEQAKAEMTDKLKLSTINNGSQVNVQVTQEGSHSSSLGARVDVELPADFDGQIRVTSEHGKVDVSGIRGAAEITTRSSGDVIVELDNAGGAFAANSLGTINSEGAIRMIVPTDLKLSVSAASRNNISVPETLPAGWSQVDGSTATALTLVGNGGTSAELWKLNNEGAGLDDIFIEFK